MITSTCSLYIKQIHTYVILAIFLCDMFFCDLGVSSHSVDSELSSDYAVPPDETIETDSDTSEPEFKLLKYTAEILKKVSGQIYRGDSEKG